MENNPLTFDLAGAISGITYPTERVIIPLDEESAFRVTELQQEILVARRRPDSETRVPELLDELAATREKIRKNSIIVTIRGLSRTVTGEVLTEIEAIEADPNKTKVANEILRETETRRIVWSAHIVKIENTDGSEAPATKENVYLLVDGLRETSATILVNAINTLDRDAAAGFENTVQSLDFFSAL